MLYAHVCNNHSGLEKTELCNEYELTFQATFSEIAKTIEINPEEYEVILPN